jgi:hypothetical protein
MGDAALRYAAEIYAPFDAAEVRRLRTFVRLVDECADGSFASTVGEWN